MIYRFKISRCKMLIGFALILNRIGVFRCKKLFMKCLITIFLLLFSFIAKSQSLFTIKKNDTFNVNYVIIINTDGTLRMIAAKKNYTFV